MFFKAVHHIWKSDFSVWGYRGLNSIFPNGASFLWLSCSQAGCWIFHREKEFKNFIGYCPRKVYWNILHCRLGRISTNALTHVQNTSRSLNYIGTACIWFKLQIFRKRLTWQLRALAADVKQLRNNVSQQVVLGINPFFLF